MFYWSSLLRLASGVIRAASSAIPCRCAVPGRRTSRSDYTRGQSREIAPETPEGVASISAPLRFRAEETEMCALWRSLRPGTPYMAGLADRSPEGTGARRAPYAAVIAALPQRGLPS